MVPRVDKINEIEEGDSDYLDRNMNNYEAINSPWAAIHWKVNSWY